MQNLMSFYISRGFFLISPGYGNKNDMKCNYNYYITEKLLINNENKIRLFH